MTNKNNEDTSEEVKIITLGDGQVGKSSLILRFIDNKFSQVYLSTIGFDFKTKKNVVLPSGDKANIKIYDTAGQERFKSIASNFIKKANGILLIYDVTNEESFASVSKWMSDIKEAHGDKVPIVLIGNKTDLPERKVTKEMGEERAQAFGINFYETSCKTGDNVEDAFHDLAVQILSKTKRKSTASNIQLDPKKQNEKRKCCLASLF